MGCEEFMRCIYMVLKKLPNEVGGMETALPKEVADKIKALLKEYNAKEEKTFDDILDFHVKVKRMG